jgi:hypothetical protein
MEKAFAQWLESLCALNKLISLMNIELSLIFNLKLDLYIHSPHTPSWRDN